jgi:hypothetical protein
MAYFQNLNAIQFHSLTNNKNILDSMVRKMKKAVKNNADKIIALFGVFLCTVIFFIGLIFKRPMYIFLGLLFCISCLGWLVLYKHEVSLQLKKHYIKKTGKFVLISNILFILLLVVSIAIIYSRETVYIRPIGYFILLLSILVSFEVLCLCNKKSYTCLTIIHIIIIGVCLQLSQIIIYPNVVGVDPWHHQMFTTNIINSGFIPEGFYYSKVPIFHVLVGITSSITNLNYKYSSFLSVSFLQVVCNVLFIFLIGQKLFNKKVGCLAALLVVLANNCIRMGFWVIPNTLGIIYIVILIFLLLTIKDRNQMINSIMIMFFSFILILTHPIASMCMAIIYIVTWLVYYILQYNRHKKLLNLVVLFSVIMFSYWLYISGHIKELSNLIALGFSSDYFSSIPKGWSKHAFTLSFGELFLDSLGLHLFIAISLIGCFYMLSRRYTNINRFILSSLALAILSMSYLPQLFGITVLEERWIYLAQILLVIPLATGINVIEVKLSKHLKSPIMISCLVGLLGLLMIVSSSANIDNNIFIKDKNKMRHYVPIQSEVACANFVAKHAVGNIASDWSYCGSPSSSIFINYFNVSNKRITPFDESLYYGKFNHDCSVKIIRSEIVRSPFRLLSMFYRLEYNPHNVLTDSGFIRIYDNAEASAYL